MASRDSQVLSLASVYSEFLKNCLPITPKTFFWPSGRCVNSSSWLSLTQLHHSICISGIKKRTCAFGIKTSEQWFCSFISLVFLFYFIVRVDSECLLSCRFSVFCMVCGFNLDILPRYFQSVYLSWVCF